MKDDKSKRNDDDQEVSDANDKNEEDLQEETVDQEKDKERNVPKKLVAEMFKDWMEQKPNWHYRDAYDNFVKLYPRAATGNPGKRWSTTHLSARFAKGSNEKFQVVFPWDPPFRLQKHKV